MNRVLYILILISVLTVAQDKELSISSGTEFIVPINASICSDYITIIDGGFLTLEDSMSICEGVHIRNMGGGILPVELISFSATTRNGEVHLNWITGSESENFGFEIERKLLKSNWTKIGFISGVGNSVISTDYSFVDQTPLGGSKFEYRLKQIDNNATFEYSDAIEIEILPNEYALLQNYPNPFNPTTTIQFQLPYESKVTLKIYDMLGSEIQELLNETKQPGKYEVDFDASDLSSGTYFYRLQTENHIETKKMLLLK